MDATIKKFVFKRNMKINLRAIRMVGCFMRSLTFKKKIPKQAQRRRWLSSNVFFFNTIRHHMMMTSSYGISCTHAWHDNIHSGFFFETAKKTKERLIKYYFFFVNKSPSSIIREPVKNKH